MMERKFMAAVFDMDGTLVDSMGTYGTVADRILLEYGLERDERMKELFLTRTLLEVSGILIEKYGIKETPESLAEKMNGFFYELYAEKIEAKPYVRELLDKIKGNGMKIVLLTASDECLAKPCLLRNGLWDYFDEKIFCSELMLSKYDRRIFDYVSAKINLGPEKCIVFEDALYAIRTAKSAGFHVCAIKDEWCKNDWEEIGRISDLFVESWKMVLSKNKKITV